MIRQKQTTLIFALAAVAGLLFMSQLPAISEVGNVHPDDTKGEKPPNTDSDADGIPDVHESLFEEWVNWSSVDGRDIILKGLDKQYAGDALLDIDNDGLTALEEYCWPHPGNCTEPGFPRGLTGKLDSESGERTYLDPRKADTDGDGMPDGYEAEMCYRHGYKDAETLVYTCERFDPLNSSDLSHDEDEDGFDIDRDGIVTVHEMFTGAEEYSHGMPNNHTTELDGLWCHHSPLNVVNDTAWPFLHTEFSNIPAACTTNSTWFWEEVDMWMGTNPMVSDSDHHSFNHTIRMSWTLLGDGLPDGWEVHFGLDPLNKTNALLDQDLDGWDADRNGVISPDLVETEEGLALGEALSTIQEYQIHYDKSNIVKSGLRSVDLDDSEFTIYDYPLSPAVQDSEISSIINHDVRVLESDSDYLFVGTRLGVTVLDLSQDMSTNYPMPSGVHLHDMILLEHSLVMATDSGIISAPRTSSGDISDFSSWDFDENIRLFALGLIDREASNDQVIAMGSNGEGRVVEVDSAGLIAQAWDVGTGISLGLQEAEASVTSLAHFDPAGGTPTLLIGTDKGLYIVNTPSGRDSVSGDWRFYMTYQSTNVSIDLVDLRSGTYNRYHNPATVRDIVIDGVSGDDPRVAWLALPSGLHMLDLSDFSLSHSGDLQHPGIENTAISGANDIHTVLVDVDRIIVGSAWGTWAISGDYSNTYGLDSLDRLPGVIASLSLSAASDDNRLFAGIDPGQFANLALMDPGSNDSDSDGMLDGWEVINGLDPTDPWDAMLDMDGDGLNLDLEQDQHIERLWQNLDEYRYQSRTENGYDSTDPRDSDTDDDGLSDGSEVFGFYLDDSVLWCHYDRTPEIGGVHICDDDATLSANLTYLQQMGIDPGTDPTSTDSDGDGMPDGWEILHRRWIGETFDGWNNWTLDPMRAEDAAWDADSDGLSNLCEYQWTLSLAQAREGELFESHGESSAAAKDWTIVDPNMQDSDGDGMPDGWEARGLCAYEFFNVGINPLNGSDALMNPDGDGFDVNGNGILELDEQFVNWLEYNIREGLFGESSIIGGMVYPEGFNTSLMENVDLWSVPEDSFSEHADTFLTSGQIALDRGSADPTDSDSDGDGMPDGWEIWFARWDVLEDGWVLNPLDSSDRWDDPDEDGMANWEEYNSIAPEYSEIAANRSSPQWFVTTVGTVNSLQNWQSIQTEKSFGSFLTSEMINQTGMTCDPLNKDSDGDGFLDGIELLFTTWNDTTNQWTLNPLVPGDGDFDSDSDGIADKREFSIAHSLPDNGILHLQDLPLMVEDGDDNQPTEKAQRVFNMILNQDLRGKRYLEQFNEWQTGSPPSEFISMMMSITDPTNADTDGDDMMDGYEYWFTEWDLDENRWVMNPLIDNDVHLDLDDDSFDCDGDGSISANETFNNLREFQSRFWGKYDARGSVPQGSGQIGFGEDAISAYVNDEGLEEYQAEYELYLAFISKGEDSQSRMAKINEDDAWNFNRTLLGISDPTHSDSDSDGIPDGWEYCYATYGVGEGITANHWSTNPVNPMDVDYDPDDDGWKMRTVFDTPAVAGSWTGREFTPSGDIVQAGTGDLAFTNKMEYLNGTRPDLNDSDGDSVSYWTRVSGVTVLDHQRDWNLSDGREVFKYGSNPLDNDSDGDMLPDWYEYAKGWNESNDNFSSLLSVQVQWIDSSTGGPCQSDTTVCLPLSDNGGILGRPTLAQTWVKFDPADASDASMDPDRDGDWSCSGVECVYTPYTNFQEFYAITDQNYASSSAVRLSGLAWKGEAIYEWWQFREWTLKLGEGDEYTTNYLDMIRSSDMDERYALIIDDKDTDYLTVDTNDDETFCTGYWTDDWDIYYPLAPKTPPVTLVGEFVYGWWRLDIDDDHIAEGTDPLNWDTDGDWLVDSFEVSDDEEDGVRGDSSPIRYDSRVIG